MKKFKLKFETVKIADSGFYTDKNLNKKLVKLSPKQEYLWDGNNGDKWEILEKYGCPIGMLLLRMTQTGNHYSHYVYDLERGTLYPFIQEFNKK